MPKPIITTLFEEVCFMWIEHWSKSGRVESAPPEQVEMGEEGFLEEQWVLLTADEGAVGAVAAPPGSLYQARSFIPELLWVLEANSSELPSSPDNAFSQGNQLIQKVNHTLLQQHASSDCLFQGDRALSFFLKEGIS